MVIDLDTEIWADIKGYEGLYQVSNLSRVKSLMKKKRSREKLLRQTQDVAGYLVVCLSINKTKKNIKVHRLVAQTFIENPENKPCVNHKNGVRNDARIKNLEWCTYSENTKHSFEILGNKSPYKGRKGHLAYNSRPVYCTTLDVLYRCAEYASNSLGVHKSSVNAICIRRRTHTQGLNFRYI